MGGVEDKLSGIHNPVTKVGGRVCIPGASLKGAYRTKIEEFLIDTNTRTNNHDKASKPCIPSTKLSSNEEKLIGKYRDRRGACHYPCDLEEGHRRGKCGNERHPICPACYLLGAAGLNGFVRTVPFLFADTSTSQLYSAAMDRATNTVKEGANRPYEVIPSHTRFEGEMVILIEDTILGWRLGEPRTAADKTLGDAWLNGKKLDPDKLIKEYVKDRLESIQWIGGYKSKGCGRVKIKVEGPI
ncbi:MAG: hypothetical protein QMD05_03715 [Candidatus Brocadiaceae bacterium]|nr:hypothetical protein [Candidatus Brocadiaceae bacterium]